MGVKKNFLNSLPITAAIFGRKLGLDVRISGSAETDCKEVIYLPSALEDKEISRNQLLGFLVHEAAHVRFTNIDAVKAKQLKGYAFALCNAIEDARIEKLMTKEYAGAEFLLGEAHIPLQTKWLARPKSIEFSRAFALYIRVTCEVTYRQSKLLQDVHRVLRSRVLTKLDEKLLKQVEDELKCFPSLNSTADVVECVLRLIEILKKGLKNNQKKQRQQQKQQQKGSEKSEKSEKGSGGNDSGSEKSEKSEKGSGGNDSGSEKSEKSEKGSDGNDSDSKAEKESQKQESNQADGSTGQTDGSNKSENSQNAKGSESDSEEKGSSPKSSTASGDQDVDNGQPQNDNGSQQSQATGTDGTDALNGTIEALKEILAKSDRSLEKAYEGFAEQLKKKIQSCRKNPGSLEKKLSIWNKVVSLQAPVKIPAWKMTEAQGIYYAGCGSKRLQIAKKQSAVARRAMMGIIQAKARNGVYLSNSGRKLNSSAICNLACGSTKIFTKKEEVKSPNTAVSVMVDLSGSTSSEQETVITAGLALIEALRPLKGVSSQLTVFPSTICRTDCMEIVPFGADPCKFTREIGLLQSGGGTPLASSLIQVAVLLAQRKEPRKIVFVVTDGNITEDAAIVAKKLVDSGVILVGIGVGQACLASVFKRVFPISEVLFNFSELQNTLMKISKRLLLEGFN